LVPDLEALPDAPEGSVEVVKECLPEPGDFVLCRVNAPLIGMAFDSIKRGIPAQVLGRNIGDGLLSLVRKLRADSVDQLLGRLDEYRRSEVQFLTRRWGDRADDKIAAPDDRCECLRVLAAGSQSVQDLEQRIASLFAEANSGEAPKQFVTFSSGHKSKGLEADRVWILRPELLPHPMAQQPHEQLQEKNLAYVCITRAKRELKFVGQMPPLLN
jgi:hypothetical protein